MPGGVLVIDDYDSWSGCRRAVDEYFADKKDRFEWVTQPGCTSSGNDDHSGRPRRRDAPPMRVSLIVCTRNRAAQLPEFLARVASLEAPPGGWELIVVDNGSTDATPHLLDRFARSAPFPVRCVHAPDPGLSRARNTGLAHARGDILAFTMTTATHSPTFCARSSTP